MLSSRLVQSRNIFVRIQVAQVLDQLEYSVIMSLASPLSKVHIRTDQTAGMGPGAGPAEQARSSV